VTISMTLRIKLLGQPRMDVDGEHRALAGKKPWALLTYLALAPRAPNCRRPHACLSVHWTATAEGSTADSHTSTIPLGRRIAC